MFTRLKLLSLLLVAVGLFACTEAEQPAALPGEAADTPRAAIAELVPTAGHKATGLVAFVAVDGGVQVTAALNGLTPGVHGFHIHENGDCSAPDASSAGGHYNPAGTPHGAPDNAPDQRHVGDLGNLVADAQGVAAYDRIDTVIHLTGPSSILGKAVIVHADADDFVTQPSGAAGVRVACGVIEAL